MNPQEVRETSKSEEIKNRYRNRQSQVEQLIEGIEERFRRAYEENVLNFLEFDKLATFPPSVFKKTFSEPILQKEILQNVGKAAEIITESCQALSVFQKLSQVTKEEFFHAVEIGIDDSGSDLPSPFKETVQSYPTELIPSVLQGKEKASETILELLEVRNPLPRLTLALAYRIGLHPAYDEEGTGILDFSTNIPRVSLRYRYLSNNRPANLTLPQLSLLVKPF